MFLTREQIATVEKELDKDYPEAQEPGIMNQARNIAIDVFIDGLKIVSDIMDGKIS